MTRTEQQLPAGRPLLDCAAAREYVLSRRTGKGGYCFYRTPEWGVEEANALDTLAALESLRLLGAVAPAPEETGRWLRGLQTVDGGYPTLTIGWAALRALALLGLEPDRSPVDWLSARRMMLLDRQGEREWRNALIDALRLLELWQLADLELGSGLRAAVARLLAAAADGAGRWARPGADLEATGVAVRLIALGDLPRDGDSQCAEFVRDCEDPTLGLRIAPTAGATSVGALWGGVVIAMALKLPLRYPGSVGESIIRLQRPSGGLGARDGALAKLRDTWLGLQTLSWLERLQEECDE